MGINLNVLENFSVRDFIKNSVLDNFTQTFTAESVLSMVISLLVALLFGVLISFIYSKFFRGVVYNRSFSITLIGMTVLTAMVTLAISTNVVISLGMVGALSIVRYRTAIKDPLDLVYIFWAITVGITAGANMYPLAVIASVIMIILMIVVNKRSSHGQVYVAVIHFNVDTVPDMVKRTMGTTKYRVKSRTLRGDVGEMAIEVFVKNQNMIFAEKLRALEGVEDVTVIQYDGEYHD